MKLKNIRLRIAAFSLLELMLVVAIIALISVAALPQVTEYNKRARGSRSSQNLKTLQSAIQQFTLDKGSPPDTGDPTKPASAVGADVELTSSYMSGAITRYVQVNESLFNSPNSTALSTNSPCYGYKVVTLASDGLTTGFEGVVSSAFNGTTRFEPAGTSGTSDAAGYAINGYEDIGRFDPEGTNSCLRFAGSACESELTVIP